MTYTYEAIMAANIPAYAVGASKFAVQVGTFTLCTGMASRACDLLGDSHSGEARESQLGDAATLTAASGTLVDSSSQLMAALNETEVRLAAAKAKVVAVNAQVASSPAAPMLIGAGGLITLLPRPDDYTYPCPAMSWRPGVCAAHNKEMQAAIALANGEDLRGSLQTGAIGLDIASMLKTIFSPVGAPDGFERWTPEGIDELDGIDNEVDPELVAGDYAGVGHYQGLTGYTPPPPVGPPPGVAGLGAAGVGSVGAGMVGGGAIGGGGAMGGGLLGVPARGRKQNDDERPEVRQWSLIEETDEFWRSPNPPTNGVLT